MRGCFATERCRLLGVSLSTPRFQRCSSAHPFASFFSTFFLSLSLQHISIKSLKYLHRRTIAHGTIETPSSQVKPTHGNPTHTSGSRILIINHPPFFGRPQKLLKKVQTLTILSAGMDRLDPHSIVALKVAPNINQSFIRRNRGKAALSLAAAQLVFGFFLH
jgi:hypothetical protein